MRKPITLALALTGMLLLPAHAASTNRLSFTDPAGDANGANDQGFGAPLPTSSTAPASVASDDILGLTARTMTKKLGRKQVPYGVEITLRLAGQPDDHTYYLLRVQVPDGCAGGKGDYLTIGYNNQAQVPVTVVDCDSTKSPNAGPDVSLGPARVDLDRCTITWQVDGSALRPRTLLQDWDAQTTVFVLGVLDTARSSLAYQYR